MEKCIVFLLKEANAHCDVKIFISTKNFFPEGNSEDETVHVVIVYNSFKDCSS